jgi:hypothetical protein
MGCVRKALSIALVFVLAALLALGWHWRHEFGAMWDFWRGGTSEPVPASGLATPRALASARDKVDSLNGWRADSVHLTAAELAALLEDGLGAPLRYHLDSLAVTLGPGRVEVTGRLDTGVIPPAAFGPLARVLRPKEWIRIGGDVQAIGDGRGIWRVDGLRIRGVRIPSPMVARLSQASLGGGSDGAVPFALPAGVRGLRVSADRVTIYGAGK